MGFTASFKASTDYREQSRNMNKGEKATATATASCVNSRYSLKRIDPPCLSHEAMKYIEHLKRNPSDKRMLDDFFDTFGTHAILGVDMGDKFVTKTTFNRKEMYSQKAEGRDVAFEASAGGWGFTASVGMSTKTASDLKKRNGSSFKSISMYTIGTSLPQGSTL